MTLVAAWIRKVGTTEELVLATDSRVQGGHQWDCAPKILPLIRGDCAVCFAGHTLYAYPIMLQIQNYIEMYDKARTRALDLNELKGHILRVLQAMVDSVQKPAVSPYGDFELILAGYSWRYRDYRIWSLGFDPSKKRFFFKKASSHAKRTESTKQFWFIGDKTYDARVALYRLLTTRKKMTVGSLDMEPFEVLVSFIRDQTYSTIGGPPQLIKIYPHMNYLGINVMWPDHATGAPTYLGRSLLPYERNRRLTIDPDSLEISTPP